MPNFLSVFVHAMRRDCTAGCSFLRSVRRIQFSGFSGRDVSPGPLSCRKMMREKLWREFFLDPSQWWDHRWEKDNPRYPDFKHKKTEQSLWLVDNLTPTWVKSDLAAMAPGLLQFHNFSWNARLRRHVKDQDYTKTLTLFGQMQQEGMVPDKFTFVPVLNACSNLRSLDEGRRIHEQIIQRGCESDIYVANGLVDMYSKCGSIGDAWSVFNKMQERDVVSWSAIIAGYVKCEQGLKAMELFQKMQQEGVEPNTVTFVGVLNACASVAALEDGRCVHEQIIRRGWESDVSVATSLVSMYAKCGSVEDAWNVFSKMEERDVVSWNAMIGGYAIHGHSMKAIGLFKRMGKEGVELEGITFICLLSACSHGGLVTEGLRYFKSMTACYDILPTTNHYACMVDLLGRAGRLEEAEELTKRMPMEGDVNVWMALLGACRIHGDIKMAGRAAERCWELEPESAKEFELLVKCMVVLETGIRVQPLEKRGWKQKCGES